MENYDPLKCLGKKQDLSRKCLDDLLKLVLRDLMSQVLILQSLSLSLSFRNSNYSFNIYKMQFKTWVHRATMSPDVHKV